MLDTVHVLPCQLSLKFAAAKPMLSLSYFITKSRSCHNTIRPYIHLKSFQNSIVHGGGPALPRHRFREGVEHRERLWSCSPGLLHWPQQVHAPNVAPPHGCPPLRLHWGSHLMPRQPNPEELEVSVLFIKQMKRKSQSLPRRLYTVINGSINGKLHCTQRNCKTRMMGPLRRDNQ